MGARFWRRRDLSLVGMGRLCIRKFVLLQGMEDSG